MNTANKLFKSSVARTSLTILSIAISFFMLPFLVNKLGDKWYGIWTIVGSLLGYYYLIDFGLATAVTRYVTQYIAKKESHNVNIIINTSLVIYTIMALVIFIITIIISYIANYFVTDTQDLYLIRLVIIIMGLNLAVEFPFKAFSGIIGAYVRYDLLSYSHFFTLLLSTGLTVFFLNRGYGILSLSLIGFICSQISYLLFYFIAKHLFSDMQLNLKYFQRDKVRELFSYSVWSFVIQLSDQLRFKIDAVVIAWLMTASHVTHYFIGARLAELFMIIVFRATNILTPVFTKYYAENNYEEIRNKLLFFTKINTILSVFGGGIIIIVGKPFIIRWMGEKYLDAYPVLVVLMIALIFEVINNPSNNVLYAISKHRYLATVNMIEGIANAALSITLIHYYGLIGVALGTAVPLIISRVFVLPLYVSKCIGLPVKHYYSNVLTTILFTVGYLGLFYALTRNLLIVPNYSNIIVVSVSALPIYLISILFISFNQSERVLIRAMLPNRDKINQKVSIKDIC